MSSIKEAVPDVSPAVLALALHEARWDVTAAVQLVGLFMQGRGSMLEELKKVLLCPAHLMCMLCIYSGPSFKFSHLTPELQMEGALFAEPLCGAEGRKASWRPSVSSLRL